MQLHPSYVRQIQDKNDNQLRDLIWDKESSEELVTLCKGELKRRSSVIRSMKRRMAA